MLDFKNISNNDIKQKIIIKNKNKIFKKEESYKGLQKYIYLSGIPNKINISPQKILIMLVLIDIIGSIVGFLINKKIGVFLGIILVITQIFIISTERKKRLLNLYSQLNMFITDCNTKKYEDITDLFNNIQMNYNGCFREDLESCCVEIQRTHNKEKALKHLKDKYDIYFFNLCLDIFNSINKDNDTIKTDFICKLVNNKVRLVEKTYKEIKKTKIDIILNVICFCIIIVTLLILFNYNLNLLWTNRICLILFVLFIISVIKGIITVYKE